MLVMRITKASVEKLDMNTKESTGETGTFTICEPDAGASYCMDGSDNRISVSLDELPDNWKLNEVKKLEIDGKNGLYKLIHLAHEDWTI